VWRIEPRCQKSEITKCFFQIFEHQSLQNFEAMNEVSEGHCERRTEVPTYLLDGALVNGAERQLRCSLRRGGFHLLPALSSIKPPLKDPLGPMSPAQRGDRYQGVWKSWVDHSPVPSFHPLRAFKRIKSEQWEVILWITYLALHFVELNPRKNLDSTEPQSWTESYNYGCSLIPGKDSFN
jgi:hypothetical protein